MVRERDDKVRQRPLADTPIHADTSTLNHRCQFAGGGKITHGALQDMKGEAGTTSVSRYPVYVAPSFPLLVH